MDTLEILDSLKKFEEILETCDGKVRFAGVNAICHMLKAYELREIDPHMAVFRAICAEEEAATSLIASIKSMGYPQSERINERIHANKAGVIIFVAAVKDWALELISSTGTLDRPRLRRTNEPGRLAVGVAIPVFGTDKAVNPIPPLHVIAQGKATIQEFIGEKVRVSLKKNLAQEIRGAMEVKANLRNICLYASNTSLPHNVEDLDGFLRNQAAIVNALLIAVGLIDPWRAPKYPLSGLVTSAVHEYVHVMSSVKKKGGPDNCKGP